MILLNSYNCNTCLNVRSSINLENFLKLDHSYQEKLGTASVFICPFSFSISLKCQILFSKLLKVKVEK